MHASQMNNEARCPLNIKKSCEQLANYGVSNITNGWGTMNAPIDRESIYSSEIHAGRAVYGAAQIVFGTSQILVGQTIKHAIKNPDYAFIATIGISGLIYEASRTKNS
jgi:hypothetical protein